MSLNLRQRFNLSRFIKGETTSAKSIELTHKRIFILPTLRGLGFVVLIAVLLLIAFVYNNNLAYLLSFLLASIFFITILHSFNCLSALVLTQGQCQAVFSGEAAGYEVSIDNPSKIKRFNIKISLENAHDFTLDAMENKRVTLYSTTHKRGWHQAETITLSSLYPLGLFRAWSPLLFAAKALVYPKPSQNELPFPEVAGNQTDTIKNRQGKGTDEYHGLKEYQQGDSIRHIHWKAFAKGQGLFSKSYDGDNSTELWLNYDQSPGHDVEERLSQLCRWVIDAERAGMQYGFTLPSLKLECNGGKSHCLKCLEALALFNN